eukprot:CAMPEP_0185387464 /NCGR_PEP_ID=MMETSP1364-20130426/66254_1 /TAXON_ID=38817 /ORGANISM="Gephyrocapsa oceanica, Strain RCC1303" /LENGTH=158 /DNA_ID=CAMNT_0027989355 /DNA_START=41 /DNA_END=518 /DNA_ORIENTATION=-
MTEVRARRGRRCRRSPQHLRSPCHAPGAAGRAAMRLRPGAPRQPRRGSAQSPHLRSARGAPQRCATARPPAALRAALAPSRAPHAARPPRSGADAASAAPRHLWRHQWRGRPRTPSVGNPRRPPGRLEEALTHRPLQTLAGQARPDAVGREEDVMALR